MKMNELINREELKRIFETDKKKFVNIQNALNEMNIYNAKYGISVDDINTTEGVNLEFCISVPEHSELKSDREFEMCGIYLANQFKINVATMIEKLSKETEKFSKLPRIKVKYTSTMGSNLTEEESNKNLKEIKGQIMNNSYFPFQEYQIY